MARKVVTPRKDFQLKLLQYNLFYYDEFALDWSSCEHDTYWNEEGAAEISAEGEKVLLEATYKLHNMALEAVDRVVNDDTLMEMFHLNKDLWPAIKYSWRNKHQDF